VKKVKEPKAPVGRTCSKEDSSTVSTHTPVAPTLKAALTPVKRTCKSSCSSEPVSPVDQDGNHSNVSTPNTPILGSYHSNVNNSAQTKA